METIAAILGGVVSAVMGIVALVLGLRLRAERAAADANNERLKNYVGEKLAAVVSTVQDLKTRASVLQQELSGYQGQLAYVTQQQQSTLAELERSITDLRTGGLQDDQQAARIDRLADKTSKLFERLDKINDELRSDRFVTVQQYQRDFDTLTNSINAMRVSLSDAMALLKATLKSRG